MQLRSFDCPWLPTKQNTIRQLQRSLYHKTKQDKSLKFYSLYDKVYRTDVLWEAWQQVRNQDAGSRWAIHRSHCQSGEEAQIQALQSTAAENSISACETGRSPKRVVCVR